jgi:hypothetical protein
MFAAVTVEPPCRSQRMAIWHRYPFAFRRPGLSKTHAGQASDGRTGDNQQMRALLGLLLNSAQGAQKLIKR